MTSLAIAFLGAVIPSLFVGIVLAFMNRKADRRWKKDQEQAQERAEAAKIQMELILSSAALSYAVAVAQKNGRTNGEMETAVAEYAIAKKNYLDHINSEYFKQKEGV